MCCFNNHGSDSCAFFLFCFLSRMLLEFFVVKETKNLHPKNEFHGCVGLWPSEFRRIFLFSDADLNIFFFGCINKHMLFVPAFFFQLRALSLQLCQFVLSVPLSSSFSTPFSLSFSLLRARVCVCMYPHSSRFDLICSHLHLIAHFHSFFRQISPLPLLPLNLRLLLQHLLQCPLSLLLHSNNSSNQTNHHLSCTIMSASI